MSHLTRQDVESWLPDPSSTKSVGLVGQLFTTISGILSALPEQFYAKESDSARQRYQNERERLFLWGQGLSAESGSLDERLDTSTELRSRVLSLLFSLGHAVYQASLRENSPLPERLVEQCSNLRRQLDATQTLLQDFPQITTDLDAMSDSDTSEYDHDDFLDDLMTYIDCLLDLAPALERPALDFNREDPPPINVEFFSTSDPQALVFCRKIRDRFQHLPKFLVERLADANAVRANEILRAHAAHADSIAIDDYEPVFSGSRLQVSDTTYSHFQSDSVFDKAATILKSVEPFYETDDADARSDATFASFCTTKSTIEHGRPRVPPIPDPINRFRCPVCSELMSGISTRKTWKEHVFNDLKPYVCTVEGCTQPATRYARSQAWAQHETIHKLQGATTGRCHFCTKVCSWASPDYFNHVSAHLREISLSVLPPRGDGEEDKSDWSNGSEISDDSVSNLAAACKLLAADVGFAEINDGSQIPDFVWNSYKPLINRLLKTHNLEGIMDYMEKECKFTASRPQYNHRLGIWSLDEGSLDQKQSIGEDITREQLTQEHPAAVDQQQDRISQPPDEKAPSNPKGAEKAGPKTIFKTFSSDKSTKTAATTEPHQRFALIPDVPGGHEHFVKSSRRQEKLSDSWRSILGMKQKPESDQDLSLVSNWIDSQKLENKLASEKKGRPDASSTLVEKYGKCQEVVGRGAFGIVRIAHKKVGGSVDKLFAVKEFHRRPDETEKKYSKRITAEFCISSPLRHPNVTHTLDLLKDSKGDYCEVMEFCAGGDLYTLILSSGKLEVEESDCFFKQLMRGVEYIHEMGVAHRDLKPENLLLTAHGNLKISDFANAECFRMPWETDAHMVSGLCGSAPYISPEEYTDKEFDARAVDVWACGVIYMAMRTGRHLWRQAKKYEDEFYSRYLEGRRDEEGYGPIESIYRARCRNVIYSVLDPNPTRRLTAAQVLKSEWVRGINLCKAGEEVL